MTPLFDRKEDLKTKGTTARLFKILTNKLKVVKSMLGNIKNRSLKNEKSNKKNKESKKKKLLIMMIYSRIYYQKNQIMNFF